MNVLGTAVGQPPNTKSVMTALCGPVDQIIQSPLQVLHIIAFIYEQEMFLKRKVRKRVTTNPT